MLTARDRITDEGFSYIASVVEYIPSNENIQFTTILYQCNVRQMIHRIPLLIKRESCNGFRRNFSLRCKADRVSSESGAEVGSRGVCSDAVVLREEGHQQSGRQMERQRMDERSVTHPNNNGARLVSRSDVEVGTFGKVVKEELEEVLGLFLLESDDMFSKSLVDV